MTVLSRPVSEKELELTAAGWRRFPSRLSWQPISSPVLSEDGATRIARAWNMTDAANGGVGCVVRSEVRNDCITGTRTARFAGESPSGIGSRPRSWMRVNDNIVGPIESPWSIAAHASIGIR